MPDKPSSRWSPGGLLRTLGSYRLSVVLMLAWVSLLLVWVAPFHVYGLPEGQVQQIVRSETFFLVLYVLYAINAIACLLVRLPAVLARCKVREEIDDLMLPSGPGARVSAGGARSGSVGLAQALARAGFRHVVAGDGRAWGVKRRFGPLGTLVLHAAVLVLFAGGAAFYRPGGTFAANSVVAEGETFTGEEDAYVEVLSRGTPPDPSAVTFSLDSVAPEFHSDILLFTRLDATVHRPWDERIEMSLASPWVVSPTTVVAIEDFGYAPVFTVGGETISYKTSTFPPGATDTIEVSVGDAKYELDLKVFSDYFEKDGEPASRTFNLANPVLEVSARKVLSNRTEVTLESGHLIRPGESIDVDGARIRLDDVTYYGVFRVVSSATIPVVVAGLLLVVAGASMRLLFPRTETLVVVDGEDIVVWVKRDLYGRSSRLAQRVARRVEETLLGADSNDDPRGEP